jgi:D-xylose transport system substrate-binding protein
MDTLKEERWHRDRDLLVKRAGELGAEVLVQAANGNDALQNAQAENMLTEGVDVLLVAPHNGKTAAVIVEAAHRAKVPVIAYDRLINDSDVDLYMSFDNERVGEMQAAYLVARRPKGNYVVIGGAPTDNNALLYHQGQMRVLGPRVSRGDIRIVADQWARDWLAVEALKIMENALTRTANQVDAVVAANDGVAGGAIQALAEQGLAGKTLVSGQDAELSACQRIAAGTQSMTVYKPIERLAYKAAEVAVKLARKEPHGEATRGIPNGKIDVPSILLAPVSVDRDNLVSTVIADGYQKYEDVYRDVPKDRWPKK